MVPLTGPDLDGLAVMVEPMLTGIFPFHKGTAVKLSPHLRPRQAHHPGNCGNSPEAV